VDPRSAGGANGRSNLVMACSKCNNAKGSIDARPRSSAKTILRRHEKPVRRKIRSYLKQLNVAIRKAQQAQHPAERSVAILDAYYKWEQLSLGLLDRRVRDDMILLACQIRDSRRAEVWVILSHARHERLVLASWGSHVLHRGSA
jgi:hypothetical protein